MSDKKYTPGPWVAGFPNDAEYANIGIHADGWVIADFPNDVAPEYVNQEANANLIAAAPELLEALEDVLHNSLNYKLTNDDPCVQDAFDAIAKAKGNT